MKVKVSNVNTPNWKEVTVKSRVPAELEKLSEIARNIWWAWNYEETELFRFGSGFVERSVSEPCAASGTYEL